jgi:hypothetical protein
VTGVTYLFDITTVNPLVAPSAMLFTIPQSIGIPGENQMVFTCIIGCDSKSSKLTWDQNKRVITITKFTNYLPPGASIKFTILGFTNPPTSTP